MVEKYMTGKEKHPKNERKMNRRKKGEVRRRGGNGLMPRQTKKLRHGSGEAHLTTARKRKEFQVEQKRTCTE